VKSPQITSLAAVLALVAAQDCLAEGVGKGCQFSSLPGINFGFYDPSDSSDLTTTTTITIKCKGNVDETITASTGANSADYNDRFLRGGDMDDTLRYQLFVDRARTTVWGDGTGNSSAIVVRQNGAFSSTTIYARMPARQDGSYGQYSDTITVTVFP
jgi:spore coat protein U-like protein